MRTEAEIKKFLAELEKQTSPWANMNYELEGAVNALRWVLAIERTVPVIGHRP